MHTKNLLVALVLVLVLGGLVWWQLGVEERLTPVEAPRVLLSDVAGESIRAVRLDQLERSVQMRVERRADGWWIVDPLEFPMDDALVAPLLDALLATPSHTWEDGIEGKGFDPPRAVLTVEVEGPAGVREHRVELGATDLDGTHVFARVDGRAMRTLRNLETLLDRPLADWRSRALLSIAPMGVVSFRREGSIQLPGGERLELDLALEMGEHWRATEPFTAQVAPEYVGPLLTSLCYLRVAGFEDDTPGPLSVYGLDPPDVRVEMTTVQGETYALRFAFAPGREALRVVREDRPQVFTVAREFLGPLFQPARDLVDRELLRAPRERLQAFEVRRGGQSLRFQRSGFGWTITSDGEPRLDGARADDAAVDALVSAIEKARVLEVLPGSAHEFAPDDLHVAFEIDGGAQGWTVGGPIEGPQGTRGRAFRRDGDSLVGMVGDELAALLELDPEALQSRELHRVRETDLVQAHVEAAWADVRRQWQRSPEGRWSPAGSQAEARDFVPLVDALLNQRALRFLGPDEGRDGVRPIGVVLLDDGGQSRASFELSLPPGADRSAPAEVWYRAGSRVAVVEGALYARLAQLLGL